jgi:hypothetical protein
VNVIPVGITGMAISTVIRDTGKITMAIEVRGITPGGGAMVFLTKMVDSVHQVKLKKAIAEGLNCTQTCPRGARTKYWTTCR